MSLWGNRDLANNAPKFAVASGIGLSQTGSQLYANTTADVFKTNITLGVFGVSTAEKANTTGESAKVGHAGWVLRTKGSSGRANRVTYETICAGSSVTGADGDTILPE